MDETAQIKKLEEQLKPLPAYKGRYPKPVVQERTEVKKKIKKVREIKLMKDGRLKEVKRLDMFMEEWLKNGGNATNAAMKIFNCKSRSTAAVLGHKYLQQAKIGGRLMLERKGWTYEELLQLALDNMKRSDNPNWWDRVMKIAGHENFLPGKDASHTSNTINIVQTEKSLLDKYISGEESEALIEVQEVEETKEDETEKANH